VEELIKFLGSSEFASPLYFWIGGALVLFLIFFPVTRKRRGLAIDLQYWKPRVAFKSKRVWVLSILVAIASILMAGVLADPQTLTKQSIRIYGKPVMVVIDVSGSMGAKPQTLARKDAGPVDARTSFEKARDTFNDLIGRRPDVNFGLLPFSTENYIARYFTYKNELFKDTLENKEEISFISTGTQIAEALGKAHRFLSGSFPHAHGSEPNTAIVLVSDLQADPQPLAEVADAIERARWAGINIYVILIERQAVYGRTPPPLPQLKVVNMVEMNDEAGINRICEEIAVLPSSLIREEEILLRKSLIPFLILPILGLIVLCLILSETRFRKIP
jgi:hypothetical protein